MIKSMEHIWTFPEIDYWQYNHTWCNQHALHNAQEMFDMIIEQGDQMWFPTDTKSRLQAAFANTPTRWDILRDVCSSKDIALNIKLLCMMECARYSPEATWKVALSQLAMSQKKVLEKYMAYGQTKDNWCFLHPGLHALIAYSDKPVYMNVVMKSLMDLQNDVPIHHPYVHILKTTAAIFAAANKEHLWNEMLNQCTKKVFNNPAWSLRWLVYGDQLFEGFPNAEEIKNDLLQRPLSPTWRPNHFPVKWILSAPDWISKKTYKQTTYVLNHPKMDSYIQHWSNYIESHPDNDWYVRVFLTIGTLTAPAVTKVWKLLYNKNPDNPQLDYQISPFDMIDTLRTLSPEMRALYLQDAQYITWDPSKDALTAKTINEFVVFGWLLPDHIRHKIHDDILNNPQYITMFTKSIKTLIENIVKQKTGNAIEGVDTIQDDDKKRYIRNVKKIYDRCQGNMSIAAQMYLIVYGPDEYKWDYPAQEKLLQVLQLTASLDTPLSRTHIDAIIHQPLLDEEDMHIIKNMDSSSARKDI